MDEIVSIRTNLIYAKKKKEKKDDPDKYIKHHEIILLVDKPKYKRTNDGEVIRERKLKQLRFVVAEKAFPLFIETLQKMVEIDESDLV